MSKNVGLVVIPYELLAHSDLRPEEAVDLAIKSLPEDVRVHQTYDDFYRQTFNIMLISDEPVKGYTFPTEPGTLATEIQSRIHNGRIELWRA